MAIVASFDEFAAAPGDNEFSPYVAEQLRYYVYLLSDPREGRIFYVGKGIGNRVFHHAADALQSDEQHSDKLDRIRAIHAAGLNVHYELLRFGLTEQAALRRRGGRDPTPRARRPHEHRRRPPHRRARSHGHRRRHQPVRRPAGREDHRACVAHQDPEALVPSMPADELFEATAGWWRLSDRREKAHYAFAVHRGVIREVYAIEGWRARQPGDRGWEEDAGKPSKRFGFEGTVASELGHYRNKSVRHLYKKGDVSPVKFVNC